MHDAGKIKLGTTGSTYREGATSYAVSNVDDFPAGTACRLDPSGGLSKTEGRFVGVSIGIDLSDTNRIVVLPAGLLVPILLQDQNPDSKDYSQVVVGTSVYISDGKATAEGGSAILTRAIYSSSPRVGVSEYGADEDVAYIDYIGGL